jgi:hypothetical protein
MNIQWNQVTWYSKLIAIIVFLVTAGVFFKLGVIYGSATTMINSFSQKNINQTPSAILPSPTALIASSSQVQQPTSTISERYTVHANDAGADTTQLLTKLGDTIQITFMVNATGTDHGGIDFRSPVINTGPISPGGLKTITLTLNKSLVFVPYWPLTNTQGPYKILIGVGIP